MLDTKQLDHLALLSRLALNKNDKEKFQKQLSDILDFVQVLQKVEVSNIEPLHQVSDLFNIWRDDSSEDFSNQELLLASAPESDNGLIKTTAIFSKNKK